MHSVTEKLFRHIADTVIFSIYSTVDHCYKKYPTNSQYEFA